MSQLKISFRFNNLIVYNAQDSGHNARDEPFFLFYLKNRNGSEKKVAVTGNNLSELGRGPRKVQRGPNDIKIGGEGSETYNEMRFEVWEKDGDDYDIKFYERDGTAGSDNRISTHIVSARRINNKNALIIDGKVYAEYENKTRVSIVAKNSDAQYVIEGQFHIELVQDEGIWD